MPLISIIIPVYNAAPYLEDCVESLLSQTFQDLELIFINDGSTDDSLRILKKYKVDCPRITVVDQENAGVSVARNKGITLAKGQYIAFVDADDWVRKDLYEKLANIARNSSPDLVLFNIETIFPGKNNLQNFRYPVNTLLGKKFIREKIYRDLIKNEGLFSVCNKLYKKEIIDGFLITFPIGNALSEDNLFNLQFFGKITSFYYLDYQGYYHRQVQGSATRNIADTDYFETQRVLFHLDYQKFFTFDLSDEKVLHLKAERFLKNIMSLIHLYFTQPAAMSFSQRVSYIKKMINSPEVRESIHFSFDTLNKEGNRFENAIMHAIKRRSIFTLFLLTQYSQKRNRKS